jgi:hypothetical protein
MSQPVKWILIIVTPLVIALCVLCFGNSQWSKHVYLWQCFVYPGYEDKEVPLPVNYTGIWKAWWEDGTLHFVQTYENGTGIFKRIYFRDSKVHWNISDTLAIHELFDSSGKLKQINLNMLIRFERTIQVYGDTGTSNVDKRSEYEELLEKYKAEKAKFDHALREAE